MATLLLADRDGPISAELWGPGASAAFAMLKKLSADAASSATAPPLIEIRNFCVRQEGRKTVGPIRKLISTTRTLVTSLSRASRPAVMDFPVQPSAKLYTTDLSRLVTPAPFIAHVSGVVAECTETGAALGGRPLRSFLLCDTNGSSYVRCVALGRLADHAALRPGNEVVLYYAYAVASLSRHEHGQLWMYDESHITKLRENAAHPNLNTMIELAVATANTMQ